MADCLQLNKERTVELADSRSCELEGVVETVCLGCRGKVARDVADVAMAIVLPVSGVGEY